MTTRVLPNSIVDSKVDVGAQLMAFIATLRPGDVLQNPKPGAVFLSDRTIEGEDANGVALNGVRYEWDGATIQQRTLRPYGQTRSDGIIVNGTHLLVPPGSPLIPTTVNWGWVTGPGIKEGTHLVLDYGRRGATLSQPAVDGEGLPLVFTSQDDRSRAGLRDRGKDNQHHNVTVIGPEANPKYTQYLEAQHGFDLLGATNPQLCNVWAKNMHGDCLYPGADGARLTTFLDAQGGGCDYVARSAVSPVNCADCTIDGYKFDHVGRTMINIEPPNSGCKIDRLRITHPTFGVNGHGFTVMSSGGDTHAHVGAVTLSDGLFTSDDAPMWLIDGDAKHLRGPYFILRNRSTYVNGFGTNYPTSSLVCIDHARPGSKVIDNKGFKLQPGRSPGMAFLRARRPEDVQAHGNDHEGGIEVGPWV